MINPKPSILSEKNLFILGVLIISIAFVPYIYWGEKIHIPVYDNLDSNVVWVKMVLDQGGILQAPDTIIHQMMCGVPLSSLSGSYDISLIWFKLFGMFWGYVLNKYIMALIGFFGMYYLLKRHIVPRNLPLYIVAGVSLSFALLPFWSFSASVAGVPLALFAFLNIRDKDIRFINWLILFLYAFYSSLVLTGFFLLLIVSSIWLWDLLKNKRFNKYLLLAIIFLGLSYVISHIPLFYSFLFDRGYVSHRTEFYTTGGNGMDILRNSIHILLYNESLTAHAPSLHKYMLISIIPALLLMIKNRHINKIFIAIIIYILITLAFCAVYEWKYFLTVKNLLTRILPMDLKRLFWLYPAFWSVLFAISLYYIYRSIKWGKYFIPVILLIQVAYVLSHQPYYRNRHLPTYEQFYAEDQFNDIKKYIGKNTSSYKIINIGLHPAISQYSGFYTLDGFSANYPLAYKHKFGKMMENEFERDYFFKHFFEYWGSWCYAFSFENGLDGLVDPYIQKEDTKIQLLDYNYDLLKEMGGQYIISTTEINTDKNPRLNFLKVFEKDDKSYWTIFLYEVI